MQENIEKQKFFSLYSHIHNNIFVTMSPIAKRQISTQHQLSFVQCQLPQTQQQ